MRVEVTDAVPEADVLAFPVGPKGLPALAQEDDAKRVAEEEEIGAKVGRTAVLYPGKNAPARRIVLVGLGPADELDADALRTAASSVAEAAERVGGTLAWVLDDSLPPSEQARAIVDGLLLGSYDPGRWKTGAKSDHPFERLVLVGGTEELKAQAERAATVADAANRARDLANTGANLLTPEKLAERASEIADEHEHLTARSARPGRVHGARHGRLCGCRAGQP